MNRRQFLKVASTAAAAAGAVALLPNRLLAAPSAAAAAAGVYWGAYISPKHYGTNPATGQAYQSPPWDLATWDLFESHAQKRTSILHWGQPWYATSSWPYGYAPFPASQATTVRQRGSIPLIDWASWDLSVGRSTDQPRFSLGSILRGDHDAYITQWATAAKAWGFPFFLRFNWEMNGDWFPWSESVNGNSAGQYAQAWRHVHDIFRAVGATNATWVWCANVDSSSMIPMASLYPGDDYVDWVGLDGYNHYDNFWGSFQTIFSGQGINWLNNSYDTLRSIAPNRPMMINETATKEGSDGGSQKAAWITDMLQTQIPLNYPAIKAVLWFNWNHDAGMEYAIESSALAQNAFAAGLALPYYAANDFANLPAGAKVAPLASVQATSTPPASATVTPANTANPAPTQTSSPVPTQIASPVPTQVSSPVPTHTASPTPAKPGKPYKPRPGNGK